MARRLPILLATAIAGCALAAPALAGGGDYAFDGGTAAQQRQVRLALEASSFDWGLVRREVTIKIVRGAVSHATPGRIVLDANLLDGGIFAWGVVQHEYAHQVDFFLLDDNDRDQLAAALGGEAWCYGAVELPHAAYGCERFASTLAWAYWQTSQNAMRPTSPADESAAMSPAAFRALLGRLVGATTRPASTAIGYAPSLKKLLPQKKKAKKSVDR
jgi:hypothetical protein